MLEPQKKSHWFRFTLGNLLVLTLGIALGFLPLRLWELTAPSKPQLMLHLKVLEVSTGDLAALQAGSSGTDGVTNLGIRSRAALDAQFDALRRDKRLKVVAEPTLTTLSGRSAWFNVGGEFPSPITTSDGITTLEWKEFGTRVEFLPTLQRNGRIHVVVETRISELDEALGLRVVGPDDLPDQDDITPAVRSRSVRTEIEVQDGETFVLGGSGETLGKGDLASAQYAVVATVERVKSR